VNASAGSGITLLLGRERCADGDGSSGDHPGVVENISAAMCSFSRPVWDLGDWER